MFQSLLKVSSNILPNYWLLDYEKGTINALKEVFGNQAVVQGCLVHWKRCVRLRDLVKSYSTMNIKDFIDASLGFYNEFNCY